MSRFERRLSTMPVPDMASVSGLPPSAVCLASNPILPVGFLGTLSPAKVAEAVVREGGGAVPGVTRPGAACPVSVLASLWGMG